MRTVSPLTPSAPYCTSALDFYRSAILNSLHSEQLKDSFLLLFASKVVVSDPHGWMCAEHDESGTTERDPNSSASISFLFLSYSLARSWQVLHSELGRSSTSVSRIEMSLCLLVGMQLSLLACSLRAATTSIIGRSVIDLVRLGTHSAAPFWPVQFSQARNGSE